MAQETPDRKVNTAAPIENDQVKRMPHERDESPDGQDSAPRGVMKQAASDLAQGLVDTDLHGKPAAAANIDTASATTSAQARPQSDAADGMRHNDNNNSTSKGNTP
ncbi:hypothetical protein [Massilia sp. DWR3-1-1]|uniref:hypothetical protein n=1 Tax=Massilia sp. DWR3-1-1 TaxID=2804559 RepID=UPI003CFB3E53